MCCSKFCAAVRHWARVLRALLVQSRFSCFGKQLAGFLENLSKPSDSARFAAFVLGLDFPKEVQPFTENNGAKSDPRKHKIDKLRVQGRRSDNTV